jgi:hypothetical protein
MYLLCGPPSKRYSCICMGGPFPFFHMDGRPSVRKVCNFCKKKCKGRLVPRAVKAERLGLSKSSSYQNQVAM